MNSVSAPSTPLATSSHLTSVGLLDEGVRLLLLTRTPQAFSGFALLLFVLFLLAQLARMRYEEQILEQTFPEYAAYKRRTARLIPGIY